MEFRKTFFNFRDASLMPARLRALSARNRRGSLAGIAGSVEVAI
jgi:hypothetical protein